MQVCDAMVCFCFLKDNRSEAEVAPVLPIFSCKSVHYSPCPYGLGLEQPSRRQEAHFSTEPIEILQEGNLVAAGNACPCQRVIGTP